jgi:DNA polymerase-1
VLKPLLEDPRVGKVGHNLKFDYQVLRRYGVTLAPIIFDTMVAGFVVNPLARAQTLSDLAYEELGIEMIPIEDLIGKGKEQITFDVATIEDATRYAAEDADVAWRLYNQLAPEIETGNFEKLVQETEWPLIPVLAEMELAGIELDKDFLKDFSKTITKRIMDLEQDIWKVAGGAFNIASPNQLQDVLFNKLGMPTQGVKKGKTGYSTAASELDRLRGAHPIIDLITEYRELMKLKTTYVDALPTQVNPSDGRIHTSFSQVIAQTGRLSSTNPNLQNIPVRTELGREIRKAFVAPKGRTFVSADYSQIDLRVAAALSKDKNMIQTFKDGIDLHQQTAAELYGISIDEVTKEQRYNAKTINFGVLYGMSPHGLSVATGMTREEAVKFIERYYELRPGLAKYIEETKAFARKNEYTATLWGRKRPCPEINSNNYVVSQSAERMAVNVPIQGTSADVIKLAMIALAPVLPEGAIQLLQIHDELIVETDEGNAEEVAKLMRETMEGVANIGVPLASETNIGKNWGDLK